ncbi:hypothetical protein QTN25_009398 [Entamoeba marina]
MSTNGTIVNTLSLDGKQTTIDFNNTPLNIINIFSSQVQHDLPLEISIVTSTLAKVPEISYFNSFFSAPKYLQSIIPKDESKTIGYPFKALHSIDELPPVPYTKLNSTPIIFNDTLYTLTPTLKQEISKDLPYICIHFLNFEIAYSLHGNNIVNEVGISSYNVIENTECSCFQAFINPGKYKKEMIQQIQIHGIDVRNPNIPFENIEEVRKEDITSYIDNVLKKAVSLYQQTSTLLRKKEKEVETLKYVISDLQKAVDSGDNELKTTKQRCNDLENELGNVNKHVKKVQKEKQELEKKYKDIKIEHAKELKTKNEQLTQKTNRISELSSTIHKKDKIIEKQSLEKIK